MFRALTSVVVAGAWLGLSLAYLGIVTLMKGDALDAVFGVSIAAYSASIVGNLFLGIFRPRVASSTATSSVSANRTGLSWGYFNPLNVLRFMLVGDPERDSQYGASIEYTRAMDRADKLRREGRSEEAEKVQTEARKNLREWALR